MSRFNRKEVNIENFQSRHFVSAFFTCITASFSFFAVSFFVRIFNKNNKKNNPYFLSRSFHVLHISFGFIFYFINKNKY